MSSREPPSAEVATGAGESTATDLRRSLPQGDLLLMAATTAIAVATLYYCQPLLAEMARDFGRSEREIAHVPMATQIGYAVGLVLFVPLGDLLERRALVCRLLLGTAIGSLGVAIAPNYGALLGCSVLIGMLAAVTQVIVPMTASLSPVSDRGRAVGIVFSGLLIGILGARTISGVVGGSFGWRSMYFGASAALALTALLLRTRLPFSRPPSPPTYLSLMKSVVSLARESSVLRVSSFYGACAFGALSLFWTTLVFFLAGPPYYYGAKMAGTLGLAGIAGASIAPLVGRSADTRGPRFAIGIALAFGLLSFAALYWLGGNIIGLLVGIVLLDLASQATQVSNQAAIYAAVPDAASRANTLYMVSYFIGGAIGTELGSIAWNYLRWLGVCAVGAMFFAAALLLYFLKRPAAITTGP